eukprot:g43266.t1
MMAEPSTQSRVYFQSTSKEEETQSQRKLGKFTVRYDRKDLQRRLDIEEWLDFQLHQLYGCEEVLPGLLFTSPLVLNWAYLVECGVVENTGGRCWRGKEISDFIERQLGHAKGPQVLVIVSLVAFADAVSGPCEQVLSQMVVDVAGVALVGAWCLWMLSVTSSHRVEVRGWVMVFSGDEGCSRSGVVDSETSAGGFSLG